MLGKDINGRMKFTIYHGLAMSLALHSSLGLPFGLYALAALHGQPQSLVVELRGVAADSQAEQKLLQETTGEAAQDKANMVKPAQASDAQATASNNMAKPAQASDARATASDNMAKPAQAPDARAAASNDQPSDVMAAAKEASTLQPSPPEPIPTPSSPEVKPDSLAEKRSGSRGSRNIAGTDEQQDAQTIKMDHDAAIDHLTTYVKVLTKKVQANLIYPDEGRQAGLQGIATVSFAILRSGQIRPDSLKIITSSGQPKLDASALKTVRSSVPFDPPPNEMTVAIAVAFSRKH
jgi:protein TonB